MKRIAILGAMLLCFGLVASSALASNTGFKLNYDLKAGGKNFVSVPYFYFPDGDVSNDMQTACDMCPDFETGGCSIVNIVRFNKMGSSLAPVTYACISPCAIAFPITPGEGYFVNASADCTADIVGSHDDDYSTGGAKNITLTQGNNPVSVPYHVQADTACDLCDHLDTDNPGGTLSAVVRIDAVTGAPLTYSCLSPCAIAYTLDPGRAYFLVPTGSPVSWDVQWRTY